MAYSHEEHCQNSNIDDMPVIPTEVSPVSDGFGYDGNHMVLVLAKPPPLTIRRLSVAPDTGSQSRPEIPYFYEDLDQKLWNCASRSHLLA